MLAAQLDTGTRALFFKESMAIRLVRTLIVLAGCPGRSGLWEYISFPVLASITMALRAESFLRKELSDILTIRTGLLLVIDDLLSRIGLLLGAGW
jgi:hypothetical protein